MTFQEPKIGPSREVQNRYNTICPPYRQVASSKPVAASIESHTLRVGFYAAVYAFWKVFVRKRVQQLQIHGVGAGGSEAGIKSARAPVQSRRPGPATKQGTCA